MNLVDPANRPSRKAPLVWAIGAAIPWLVLVVGQLVWFAVDDRLWWLNAAAAAVTLFECVRQWRPRGRPASLQHR